ncbi:HlyD family secretion protein [Niallia nealsonii]|uniref:HlyD family secretion protein n=1 Tax=Niallia nealsonii TaxID=115979 RepID=A0A2N0Z7U9_9BACI|nr:efflux RND transporter periplasmic adaptor subunit [Niallia nealsonii]PKG25582.1 HlyD family secretion protein [Niallia nealsonii]
MNAKRMILINIILLIVLVGGGFTGYYFYDKSVSYISTDNAQIAGQQISIAAPASGKLTSWDGNVSDHFNKNDKIGTIKVTTETGTVDMHVAVPANSTIVQSSAVENSYVAAGTSLAKSYDMSNLWVTANVDETDLNDVKIGQDVDLYVDAYPDTTLTGKVDSLGLATSATFSLLPTSNSSGNYTKETQVIPVKISIDNYGGLDLVPGMNVTVRIHK